MSSARSPWRPAGRFGSCSCRKLSTVDHFNAFPACVAEGFPVKVLGSGVKEVTVVRALAKSFQSVRKELASVRECCGNLRLAMVLWRLAMPVVEANSRDRLAGGAGLIVLATAWMFWGFRALCLGFGAACSWAKPLLGPAGFGCFRSFGLVSGEVLLGACWAWGRDRCGFCLAILSTSGREGVKGVNMEGFGVWS